MTTAQQSRSGAGTSPLDDLTYDLVTILHEKAKGLEAYDKYLRDAQGNQEVSSLLEQIRQQDQQWVQKLQQQLGSVLHAR